MSPEPSLYVTVGFHGYRGVTGDEGRVTLTLLQGSYYFRADYDGVQFWSGSENVCTLPGCESAAVTLPGGLVKTEVTIDYTYDTLYRLTAADYSDGTSYQYVYDAVGNRLTQETVISGQSSVNSYQYDAANRLTSVDGVSYTFDANGNLLSDGENTYTYDSANRLISVSSEQGIESSYAYNGLGDRLSQTVNGQATTYTLDLNTGLTQVLEDGENTYLYGNGRIAQTNGSDTEYYLGDALGSVRQLTDTGGAITLTRNYNPYGEVTTSIGSAASQYGFTGEFTDSTGMVYLRARYYSPYLAKFTTRDTWGGDANTPMSYSKWNYVDGNPVNYTDPGGLIPISFPVDCHKMPDRIGFEDCVRKAYGVTRPMYYSLASYIRNPLSNNDQPGCHYIVSPDLPITYSAPGYIEGYSATLSFSTRGEEIVYDFATMTRAIFYTKGTSISDSIIGGSISVYAGFVGYIQSPGYGFNSQRTIFDDYNGRTISDSIGVSFPVLGPISIGGFKSNFASLSLNPMRGILIGVNWSAALLGIPVLDVGGSVIEASGIRPSKPYTYPGGNNLLFVDVGTLKRDILFGDQSPWNRDIYGSHPNPFPLNYAARLYEMSKVDKWAEIYDALHNGEKNPIHNGED